MQRSVVTSLALVGVLSVSVAGFVVFEQFERKGLVTASERACSGQDQPEAGAPAVLPLDLPLTEGEKVLRVATQGATTVAFASEPGGREDIVAVRDKVLADLATAGYTVVGTDQEPGYEAEAELAGTHPGSLKVSPLCEGLLEVRYKIEL